MDIRYSCNQKDFKRYTTEEMRDEMLITGLYKADEVVAVYSHVDRMVTLGCMPVHETVSIDKGIDVWANFGTHYFLERREIGIFNIGDGAGTVTADGKAYHLNYKDCLYITKGNEKVSFKGMTVAASNDAGAPFLYNWDGSGEKGNDLYFNVTVNDQTYNFCVESYLCGADTDVYKAVKNLKVGDTVDLEGFLYWYEGVNPHITSVTVK
mgnify:CR=1 FL=1